MLVDNYLKVKLTAMSLAYITYPPKSLSSIATTYRRLHNFYPQTYINIVQRGFACTCFANSSSSSCSSPSVRLRRNGNVSSTISLPLFYQQNLGYGRFAYDEYASEEESDSEIQSSSKQLCDSTLDNVEEWRRKLTSLVPCKDDQEVVSRERKDRRDFEHLSALATRMGLHSRQYDRVVVFSKVPLANYRSDLDSKRPQREVTLPFGLQRAVASHLRAHLSRKAVNKESSANSALLASDAGQSQLLDEGFDEQEATSTQSVIADRIIQRRSLEMYNKQREWQVRIYRRPEDAGISKKSSRI
ncbi:hypothetical protein OROGR_009392 [Orobanche gracilis]